MADFNVSEAKRRLRNTLVDLNICHTGFEH